MKSDRITNWPVDERPRERLLNQGSQHLSDAELLAILLRVGVGPTKQEPQGLSAVALARSLLVSFDGLSGLDRADVPELLKYSGVSSAKVCSIKAALELGKRLKSHVAKLQSLESSSHVFSYVSPRLSTARNETVISLFLDGQNHLLAEKLISEGTPTESVVVIRKILEEGLRVSATAFALVHNHPSGSPYPSAEDDKTTTDLDKAASLLSILMIDHIIVGGDDYYSYADSGRLEGLRAREAYAKNES
jgi:DNA repair protein RadC